LSQFGKAKDKHFPRDFLDNATYDQLHEAFMAYALGDGHWQSENSCTLVTTSPRLRDDLCEIAVKLGYKVQYKEIPSDNPNHNTRYNVYFSSGKVTKVDKNPEDRDDQSFEYYKGKVYCLGVEETENFVIRQRGYVWVSGNTTNPGGPGHVWVKKLFVDPAPPGESFWATDLDGNIIRYPDNYPNLEKRGQPIFKRRFIPAKLSDNPHLYNDGSYEANLLSLPEDQRRKLLDGDWSVIEGAAFPEFNPKIHVLPASFPIPRDWRRFRAADYGYGSYSCVLWFAIEPGTGCLYVYRELYVSKVTGLELADMILDLERGERIDYGVLDSSVWANRGQYGPSIAEEMIRRGCRWRKADRTAGSRIAGKNRLHELLKIDPYTQKPGILFLENCRQVLTDLPMLPSDPDGGEDIDDRYRSDHSYDALRYGIMSRPKTETWSDPMFGSKSYEYKTWRPADPVFGY